MRRSAITLAIVAGIALSGCGALTSDRSAPGGSSGDEMAGGSALYETSAPEAGVDEDVSSEPQSDDRQIVSSAQLMVSVDDPSAAAEEAVGLAEDHEGLVEQRTESDNDHGERSATLTLRVPSAQMQTLLDGIAALGEVSRLDQQADDVTGAARDLDARIGALETSTERLENLMAEAESTTDLLAAEGALSTRQAELEQLLAERRALADRVAMSTIRVNLVRPGAESDDTSPGFGEQIGEIFATSVQTLLLMTVALLPWLIALAIPVTILIVILRRRGRARRAQTGAAPHAPAASRQPAPSSGASRVASAEPATGADHEDGLHRGVATATGGEDRGSSTIDDGARPGDAASDEGSERSPGGTADTSPRDPDDEARPGTPPS